MSTILWKTYAFIFCGIQLINIFDGGYDFYDIVISVWSLVGLFALLGYIYQKPIGWLVLWRVYFGLFVFVACVFLSFVIIGLMTDPDHEGTFLIALLYLVQIPYWFAIWAYAYKSQKIWAQNA